MKFPGDTDVFRKAVAERSDELAAFSAQSRAAGGIHHRFGVGDGFVLVVDEWQTFEQFQQYFARPELQAFIGSSGASGPPDIAVSEALTSPDQY